MTKKHADYFQFLQTHCYYDNLQIKISHTLLQDNIPSAIFTTNSLFPSLRTRKPYCADRRLPKWKKVFFPHFLGLKGQSHAQKVNLIKYFAESLTHTIQENSVNDSSKSDLRGAFGAHLKPLCAFHSLFYYI